MIFHTPVLPKETIDGLEVKRGGRYIDATLGGGGHTARIIESGGIVLGIDQDDEALAHVRTTQAENIKSGKLVVVKGNFKDIDRIAEEKGFTDVDGVLFDLGVSSFQIDNSGRGFSFMRDEELDMRMDETTDLTAYEIVNTWSRDELYEIFAKYGEEIKSRAVADAIIEQRAQGTIETTQQLADIVKKVIPNGGKIHPATRIFQAIRIAVNNEVESLNMGLEKAFSLLKSDARLAVISFHSIEDRIVKLYFLKLSHSNKGVIITKKPIIAGDEESSENRRSRSAKLRIIKKI